MSRLIFIAILGSVFLVSNARDGFAFDGERKGFVLGFGVGGGTMRVSGPNSKHIKTAHTNLKIGFGATDRLLVYYSGHTSVAIDNGDWKHLFATPAIAAAFYLKPTSPSLYFLAEVGTTVDVDNYASGEIGSVSVGPNLSLGVGFEMFRYVTLELAATRVFLHDIGLRGEGGFTIYALTLGVLGF